jgi:predicted RNA-binding Zn-ribbon protein involved in translation (DUF1610 family)
LTPTALLVKTPIQHETCEGCGKPIIRNLARLNEKTYHYGCLKRTKAKPTHYCLDCNSYLTGSKITKVLFVQGEKPWLACGNCGSTNLKRVSRCRP